MPANWSYAAQRRLDTRPAARRRGAPARRPPQPQDLGGLFSAQATSHRYRARIDLAGTPHSTPPSLGNIAGADSPNQFHSPNLTTLGGALSASAAAHRFQTAIDAMGKPIFARSMVFDTSALSAAIRAAALPAHSAYIGVVATRCYQAQGYQNPNNKDVQSVTTHFARDNITALSIGFANYYDYADKGEVATGAPMSVTVDVEYAIGTFTSLTIGGRTQAAIASGQVGFFDKTTLAIPIPQGALLKVHSHLTNSDGVPTDTLSINAAPRNGPTTVR